MSQWKFTSILSSTSRCNIFIISADTIHHLEQIFHTYRPHVFDIDEKNHCVSMQFNTRLSRLTVQTKLLDCGIFNLFVEGYFNFTPITHPNSNILINDSLPLQPGPSTSTQSTLPTGNTWTNFSQNKRHCGKRSEIDNSELPRKLLPTIEVIKFDSSALPPIQSLDCPFKFDILSPANHFIPAKTSYTLDLNFVLIPPLGYTLKFVSALQFAKVYVSYDHERLCYQPLTVTLLNTSTSSYEITPGDKICSLTCHRQLPCNIRVVDADVKRSSSSPDWPQIITQYSPRSPSPQPLPTNFEGSIPSKRDASTSPLNPDN